MIIYLKKKKHAIYINNKINHIEQITIIKI